MSIDRQRDRRVAWAYSWVEQCGGCGMRKPDCTEATTSPGPMVGYGVVPRRRGRGDMI